MALLKEWPRQRHLPGAAVQRAFSWMLQTGTAAGTPVTAGHTEVPFVHSGRRVITVVIAASAGTGVDLVWPAGAVYCTPFVQTFQDDAVTDIEAIEWTDITDIGGYSPDLTSLTARVGSIESEDLPVRVTDLESAVTAPTVSRYATRAAAEAASIPVSTESVETYAYAVGKPPVKATFVRDVAASDGGFQSADGAYWRLSDAVIQPEMLGAEGDGSTIDEAAWATAKAIGRPLELVEGMALSGRGKLVTAASQSEKRALDEDSVRRFRPNALRLLPKFRHRAPPPAQESKGCTGT